MKVFYALALLLQTGAMAMPAADPSASSLEPVDSLQDRSAAPEPEGDLVRRNVNCKIVSNDGNVACRQGPGTSYTQTSTAYVGNTYSFKCYKTGSVVGGNNVWDFIPNVNLPGGGCYVSAFYTSSACTTSTLPPC